MTEANEAARAVADRYWDDLMELDPLWATQVGDERFDDRLPDPTGPGRERRRAAHERALARADAIRGGGLHETERTTLDVLRAVARRELSALRFRTDQVLAVAHLLGPGMLLAFLASAQRADTEKRARRYVGRLEAIPAYLEGQVEVAEEGVASGFVAPAVVVDRTIAQLERLLALAPEASPGMAPVQDAPGALRSLAGEILRDRVWPAYRRYLDAVRAYRRSTRDSIGLSALPDGPERYAAEIEAFVTIPLDPEDLHRIGRERLAAIDEERRGIASALGHPDMTSAVRDHRSSGKDTPRSREHMVELAEDQVRRGWEAAAGWFGRLPERNCEVRAIEEFREQDTPAAFYEPPSGDDARPGTYYVNTSDHAERELHTLAAITYHEANPGHHLQLAIQQGFTDRPPLRRFGGSAVGSAFVEGWGLYAERLADEMDLYLGPYERVGMLAAQAWRAARLVVDTGIHAFGWDRERAVRTLHGAIGGPRLDAEIEVDRYICWPGQALSYMVGQLEIERWRATLARREGDAFSLRSFHDRVLSLGSLPLESLQRELDVGPRP